MAIANVSDTLSVRGIVSDYPVEEAERLWLSGLLYGDAVPVTAYQDSSHFTNVEDEADVLVPNVKYAGDTQAEIDLIGLSEYGVAQYGDDAYGGYHFLEGSPATVSLPVSAGNCQLHVQIRSDIAVSITVAKFYAYDGIADANPYRGITFRAAEGDVSTSWVAANGSSQALTCSTRTAALVHDYYIAVSATPTNTGEKQGKLKFLYTYSQV